jgi:hypothetical protein
MRRQQHVVTCCRRHGKRKIFVFLKLATRLFVFWLSLEKTLRVMDCGASLAIPKAQEEALVICSSFHTEMRWRKIGLRIVILCVCELRENLFIFTVSIYF